ncbi:hypothetical protein H671_7g17852 [Cricetulus griseus]|nr:hypothetical protein H671_7g17852 [Cricetulus griseus]
MAYSLRFLASLSVSGVKFLVVHQLKFFMFDDFVYMVEYIDEFSYFEPSLRPWDEACFIIVDEFSDMFLDMICQNFVEYFCINVHEAYWSLCGLDNKEIVAS